MEKLSDIKKFLNDVNNYRDVTYTKQLREDALCYLSGLRRGTEMYIQELTQFVFDMTCGNPKDALKALQRKEQLVSDLENAFGNAGIKKELDPDKVLKGINEESLKLECKNKGHRDLNNRILAMPEEGTYQCSKDRVAAAAAKPKTEYDGKQLGSAYKITIREPGE